MSSPDDPRLAPLRELVAVARSGRQREAADELLPCVESSDPLVAWVGAAAVLGWMWWNGSIGEAADMVERVVLRVGGQAAAQGFPPGVEFATAVMVGARYAGTERESRLVRMADALPSGFPLGRRLREYAQDVDGSRGWGIPLALGPRRDLLAGVASVVPADPGDLPALSQADADTIWRGAASAGHADLLVALFDAGRLPPAECPVKWPLAQALYEAGRADRAEAVLLDARADWWPLNWWETLPRTPVLAPGLRPVVTPSVVAAHLTLPLAIGGDAPR